MINKRPEKIKKMFDELAPGYDFMNSMISFGVHKLIKKSGIKFLKLQKNAVAADLCCGTGDIAGLLAENKNVKKVFAVDFSDEMLKIARKRKNSSKIEFIKADCTDLPFENASFDVCTMFFGLRNLNDPQKAVSEINRVLKNGGQFLHLDIFKGIEPFNSIFDGFARLFAKLFSNNPESYKYLIASKNEFYSPQKLAQIIEKHGFKCSKMRKWAFGIISAQLFIKDCSQPE